MNYTIQASENFPDFMPLDEFVKVQNVEVDSSANFHGRQETIPLKFPDSMGGSSQVDRGFLHGKKSLFDVFCDSHRPL